MLTLENHVLAPHTTLGIGGAAKIYTEPESREDLVRAAQQAKDNDWPIFVLGGGSNTLIHDDGFAGMVIHPMMKGIEFSELENGNTRVTVGAGEAFDDVVQACCAKNLGGIECLSGIPGSAGGALVQNIGAYGQEICESFVEADVFDLESMSFLTLKKQDLHFSYRSTALKTANNKRIVVSVTLRLMPFDAERTCKTASEHGFNKIALVPPRNASEMRRRVIETRRTKGMCYDVSDVDTHSVGSFFMNPVVSQNEATRLNSQTIIRMTNMSNEKRLIPMFPVEGGVKLSAAWLIEQAGFSKGYRFEQAALSSKHCLAIINPGSAMCRDVLALATRIVQTVFIKYHVELVPEIIYLTKEGVTPIHFDLDISKLAGNVRSSSMATF